MAKAEITSTKEQPIRRFARFFKAYGFGLSLVVSAVPFMAAYWEVIPLFAGSKNALTIITTVASYLLVGFVFSQRHTIARWYFPGRQAGRRRVAYAWELRRSAFFSWVPAILTGIFILALFLYWFSVHAAVERVVYDYAFVASELPGKPLQSLRDQIQSMPDGSSGTLAASVSGFVQNILTVQIAYNKKDKSFIDYEVRFPDEAAVQAILRYTPSASVPYWPATALLFLGMFLSAVLAFVLIGLREYLQEELGLSDTEQIVHPTVVTQKERFEVYGVPNVYGFVEYSPYAPDLVPILSEPLCALHNLPLQPASIDEVSGNVKEWIHVSKENDKIFTTRCSLKINLSMGQLREHFEGSAKEKVMEAGVKEEEKSIRGDWGQA